MIAGFKFHETCGLLKACTIRKFSGSHACPTEALGRLFTTTEYLNVKGVKINLCYLPRALDPV